MPPKTITAACSGAFGAASAGFLEVALAKAQVVEIWVRTTDALAFHKACASPGPRAAVVAAAALPADGAPDGLFVLDGTLAWEVLRVADGRLATAVRGSGLARPAAAPAPRVDACGSLLLVAAWRGAVARLADDTLAALAPGFLDSDGAEFEVSAVALLRGDGAADAAGRPLGALVGRDGADGLAAAHLYCVAVDEASLERGPWRVEHVPPETVLAGFALRGRAALAAAGTYEAKVYFASGAVAAAAVLPGAGRTAPTRAVALRGGGAGALAVGGATSETLFLSPRRGEDGYNCRAGRGSGVLCFVSG